ncbi:MFS general substrate transporter [Hesseltinella vesiculosa]|uniref:MFS general substrate transporter n=1 Tax=Hesseltinella vesiculosa TaxID=101127 RepID=A0A1X2GJS8_9FUNG|nr:MFS general substrate transporter [Hesseltinella vesiculosa]
MAVDSNETTRLVPSTKRTNTDYQTTGPQVIAHDTTDTTEMSHDLSITKKLNGVNVYTILVGLWVGVFLSSLDSSIVATIYPRIGTEFHRSNDIIWVATSYLLSYAALQPLYGRLSDSFGRQTTYQFAVTVFFIGSLLCGAATSLEFLVFARTVAGIGGGGLNTISSVITSDLVSLRDRASFQGYANLFFGAGAVIGAPLGGLLSDTIGWRFCFYLNIPILLGPLYASFFKISNYNLQDEDNRSFMDKVRELDGAGAFFVVCTVFFVMLATSLGGNSREWSDPFVIGLLAASLLSGIVFVFVEKYYATFPIMPIEIISQQTPLASAFTNFFCLGCAMTNTFVLPLYFQVLLNYSASQSGLFFLPRVVGGSVGSLYAGYHIRHRGEYRKLLIASSVGMLLAVMLISTWNTATNVWWTMPVTMLDGFSGGVIITASLISMISCVKRQEMATMTSISYLFRTTGGVIGVSLSQAIFQGVVKDLLVQQLAGVPDAAEIIEIARKSMMDVRTLVPADYLETVLASYDVAIHYAFLFSVALAALSLVSTLFIRQHDLH